jgi:hypothetical protein
MDGFYEIFEVNDFMTELTRKIVTVRYYVNQQFLLNTTPFTISRYAQNIQGNDMYTKI